MKYVTYLIALLGLLSAIGCQTGQLPDPNDPKEAGLLAADVIRRQLKGTSDMLMDRVNHGELTDDEFKTLIAKRANELLDELPMEKISPSQAWEYGEIFRTAKKWDKAKQVLQIAVAYAIKTKNEDRRVNDILRLAHAEAELGETGEAIKTAYRVMDATPTGSAPILPGILLELTPAVEGHGKDVELAKLLEKAIDKEMKTIVDASTQPGQAFIAARPFHVRHAWDKIVELYSKSDMPDEARNALSRKEEMMEGMRGV